MDIKFKMKLPFMKNSRAAKASAAAHKMRLGKDPYFDWTIILTVFILSIILCVSFGFALWHEVRTESFSSVAGTAASSSSATPVPSLNAAQLEKSEAVQQQKSAAILQYERGYAGPSDPSI